MSLHDLIFTRKKPDAYLRHILCWLSRLAFLMFYPAYLAIPEKLTWAVFFEGLAFNGLNTAIAIVYTYTIVYYLYPKYFKGKTPLKFFGTVFIFTVVIFAVTYFGIYNLWNLKVLPFELRAVIVWNIIVHFTTSGPPVVCCLFLISKMIKNFFLQTEQKVILTKENADAEMQLLKAQVHPHFLFNTLNNIYSFILSKSPDAKDLIAKLSHTLRYMINECKAPLVPLEKELKMIEDYMGLEKVRYDKSLVMTTEILGEAKKKLVAPLLLIPFIENSFKHGSSKILKNPWIHLRILISDDLLSMELNNSKPSPNVQQNTKTGIGLKNVSSRLQLLYPGNHKLVIKSEEDIFSVQMTVPLERSPEDHMTEQSSTQIGTAYQSPTYV